MNKYDFLLIITVLTVLALCFINQLNTEKPLLAKVFYDNKEVLEIDLSKDDIYKVKGYLGDVTIEVLDNKIRVIDETSNRNLCSKQGFVDNINESIICLPNKIVIEFDNEEKLDGVVK